MLLEIRQITLKVIEDALEIEYRSQFDSSNKQRSNIRSGMALQLPPISSYRGMDEKEDVFALADIVTDMDDICSLHIISVFLPTDFPKSRNPFLLGKTVDELAFLLPPQPDPGNLGEELKVLELLRYKRASKALLKAEAQVLNKLPVALPDLEKIFLRIDNDMNVEKLVRAVCVFLDNDRPNHGQEPALHHLYDTVSIEPFDFLIRLNAFRGDRAMRIDVQAAVRQMLRDCRFEYITDSASVFLIEWINSVLNRKPAMTAMEEFGLGDSKLSMGSPSVGSLLRGGRAFDEDDDSTVGSRTRHKGTSNNNTSAMQALASQNRIIHKPDLQIINTQPAAHGDLVSLVNSVKERDWRTRDKMDGSPTQQQPNLNSDSDLVSAPIVEISDGGGKRKKRKNKFDSESAAKMIKEEVQKIMGEQAASRRAKLSADEDDGEGLATEQETLASVRFELVKMQQELLRRNVLDPRHYKATSVDTLNIASSGLTVPEVNRLDPVKAAGKSRAAKKLVPVAERGFGLRDGSQGQIELVWDVGSDLVVGTVYRFYELNAAGDVITPEMRAAGSLSLRREKEPVSFAEISKLSFNKITGSTLDSVMEVPSKDKGQRLHLTDGLFDLLQSRALEYPMPLGELTLKMDRLLYKKPFTGDNVLADLQISRSAACDALSVVFTPVKNQSNLDSGPIYLTIQDKELQVLLINQRSLFLLSKTKWTAMQMISQWIVSRLQLKRVRVVETYDLAGTGDDLPSLLDVTLDRRVEIPKDTVQQWLSRNVPNISGIKIEVTASQDLEMLRLEMLVKVPQGKSRRGNAELTSDGLIDLSKFDEDNVGDDIVAAETSQKRQPPLTIPLMYRLTVAELNVFGSADVKNGDRKVALNNSASGSDHPSSFMWNVFNRLHIDFRGSTANPFAAECSADNPRSWSVRYDRRLLRDIRTISGGVMIITVSAVGNELLYEAEPTDGSIYKQVGSKLMTSGDIEEMVNGEGWPLTLLDASQRGYLAYRIVERLKVVADKGLFLLQPHYYPETRLLSLNLMVPNRGDLSLGSIEISNIHTLMDLRTLIKYEIDRDLVPRMYRFLYKGNPCSVRQESFRRAWECLPRVSIVSKVVKNEDVPPQTKAEKKEAAEKEKKEAVKLEEGQRRVNKKLVPVPAYTLCLVRENSNDVYLYHDGRDIVTAGDVVRIGHPQSRDYIVGVRGRTVANQFPKQLRIDPAYDLLREPDFDTPIVGLYPYPAKAGQLDGRRLLADKDDLDLAFELPTDPSTGASADPPGPETVAEGAPLSGDKVGGKAKKAQGSAKAQSGLPRDDKQEIRLAIQRLEDEQGGVWREAWLWKCIPPDEDKRPRWRKLYDDGAIKYTYEYAGSREGVKLFGVLAPFRYLEVLCTDCRCPQLTPYAQRAQAMESLSIDFYTRTAFNGMCNWFPQYAKGVEASKFVKMIKECKVFPDIKKPGRVGQLDILYQKEVRGENGIVGKYVDYTGFTRLLQEVALLRYPPAVDGDGEDLGGDGRFDEDMGSVGGSVGGSSISSKSRGSKSDRGDIMRSAKGTQMISKSGKGNRGGKAVGGGSAKMDDKATEGSNQQAIVDPVFAAEAYRRLIMDFVMNHKDWDEAHWREAKAMCMKVEAKPYCAQTRIATMARCQLARHKYVFFRSQLIQLQAHVRRRIASSRIKKITKLLVEDWLFRLRYHAANLLVAFARRYLARCQCFRLMKKIKEQQIVIQKARRARLKRKRQLERKGIIYKEIKRINGVMALLTLWRKDNRSYSKDYGIIIQIYIPKSQMTYKFPIEEKDLRTYMMIELKVEALSANDLLDKRNLEMVVATRLIIRESVRPGQPPQVLFSKQGLGQRGAIAMTRGKVISKHLFVCELYETGSDVSVQAYHQLSSTTFNIKISILDLRDWARQHHRDTCQGSEFERQKDPDIVKPSRKLDLFRWAINNMVVDTRKGRFKVLFACQMQRSRKLEMVMKMQAVFRMAMARPLAIRLLDRHFLVVRVSHKADEKNVYYVDRRSGVSSWDKPKLLRSSDLPTKPKNVWYSVKYLHGDLHYEHYVNPYNGRYTHLSINRAATIIQCLARNHLLKLIQIPQDILKTVVPLVKSAADIYERNNRSLRAVINHALVTHIVNFDELNGKRLYVDSLDLSEASPLVTRAFAMYLLCSCEPPLQLAREKALRWLADAKRRDSSHKKFTTAYNIYRFSLLNKPKHVQAMLNLALAELLIYGNKMRSEKLMRRALAADPFNTRVIEMWNYVKEQFPERQLMYYPASRDVISTKHGGKKRLIHARPCMEDPAWAGWCYVTEDPYKQTKVQGPYWYNPVNGRERTKEPDFKKEFEERRVRSKFEGEKDGLEMYFDPLTSSHFQYHLLSDTYQ